MTKFVAHVLIVAFISDTYIMLSVIILTVEQTHEMSALSIFYSVEPKS